MNRDIIAIGASAGGVDVLLKTASELPGDLPASLFVALHMVPFQESRLPALLTRRGSLEARHPLHGEPIEPGHIYIAPPDMQLLLRPGFMEVVRGPRENGQRPAADVLLRTAAWSYGRRVVGIVLSGFGDCGSAGMLSVEARGGTTVVQDPESAEAPDMPRSVLKRVKADFVVKPAELGSLIVKLASGLVKKPPAKELEESVSPFIQQLEGTELGAPVQVSCPACQGVLTEAQSGTYEHFRCHVGHAFSLESLVHEQGEEVERALWAAVRALEESAALNGRLARSPSAGELEVRFAEKARTQAAQADMVRRILLRGEAPPGNGPTSEARSLRE